MHGNASYEGELSPTKKWVYYAGSDALEPGYALCYDVAASKSATDNKDKLGIKVLQPATANLMAFAGFCVNSSSGAGWIQVYVPTPGVMLEAFCNVNATAFTTMLGLQNAAYSLVAISDPSSYSDGDIDTLLRNMVCLAAETANTSSTAANKYVMFKGW